MLNTPILLIIFNRYDTTQKVFQAIRKIRPTRLFIAADGPRNKDEVEKCERTRSIIQLVDWPCEVKTLLQTKNLGPRQAVPCAINWFFREVDEGIILEDDCLPHPSFFTFSQEMLSRYRQIDSVQHISGGNYQFGKQRGSGSYYFSRIAHTWGWATWKRAWKHYDVAMRDFPEFLSQNGGHSVFPDKQSEHYWLPFFNRAYRDVGGWDYQWVYTVMKRQGVCIIPNHNLISNIGFGKGATSTDFLHPFLSSMDVYDAGEIACPASLEPDHQADLYTITYPFGKKYIHRIIQIWWGIGLMKVKNYLKSRRKT